MSWKRSIEILTNPITISLILGSIIILLLPKSFPKFHAKLVDSSSINKEREIAYYDLDHDGNSEEIWFLYFNPNVPSVIVNQKGKIVDQWNYEGRFDEYSFCDYDDDGYVEIFLFTNLNDTTYLQIISPLSDTKSELIRNQFIDTHNKYKGEADHRVYISKFTDNNGDGFLEINFSISAGMTRKPRRFYSFDLANLDIQKSLMVGNPLIEPIVYDINRDGFCEHMFKSGAFGNWKNKGQIPYPDSCCWLMVFDKNLDFLFEPVPIGQYKTTIQVAPIIFNKNVLLCVLKLHMGNEDEPNELLMYDAKGTINNKQVIDDYQGATLISRNTSIRNDLYIIVNDGVIYQIDEELNLHYITTIEGIRYHSPIALDVDLDGEEEFLFQDPEGQFFKLTRNDFSDPVKLDMPNPDFHKAKVSLIRENGKEPLIFLQTGRYTYTYQYNKNPLFYLQYLLYLGIYIMVFLFVFTLQKIQNIRAKHKYETQRQITELQLTSAKNKMSPHFTLNLIQSIAVLFDKNDREKAMYVFAKYTKMLRNTLINSDQILVTLEEELDYVVNYLELERFRYSNRFEYEISISENVNQKIQVPKMLIHTFVENAVKHGIKHLETAGNIKLNVYNENSNYYIEISDNGVGRSKAKEYAKLSTGKGLEILDTILEYHRKEHKINITYEVIDLFNNFNQAKGTKVIITIPQ